MAGPLESVAARAEEALGRAGDALSRVAEEVPEFARLLRREPRLRAALTDIAVGGDAKAALLRDLLGSQLDATTLEVLGVLTTEALAPDELLRAAADLARSSLLAAAEADGSLEEVEDELFRFARVVDAEPSLRAALTDPGLPAEGKVALLQGLLEGKARPATLSLARLVVETGLERDPAKAFTELADRAAARRGRVVVEARSAVPIDVQRRVRLTEALARVVGRQVDLEVVIDPDVIGGVVARVGDEIIDGSVKRKLELALEELSA